MTGPALQIRLLGGFAVTVGGDALTDEVWRLRKAKSLLKLLALAPEQRMHRERLGELLWPERDSASIANNLHQAMYVARRALEAAHVGGGACLALHEHSLCLSGGGTIDVDVVAFEAAAAQARSAASTDAYTAALELYAGELLPEDIHEHWTSARRQTLKSQHVGLLLELAELQARAGQRAAAVLGVQRAVLEDPLHEGAYRTLMRLLTEDGRRQQALAEYQQLSQTLRHELEAKPTAETRRVYQEILVERDAPADELAPASSGVAPVTSKSSGSQLPLQLTSFIGRERELTEVRRLLEQARLLTLSGPGGSGKTRLALEIAAERARTPLDGVFLVELAPINDAALVAQLTATALGIELRSQRDAAEVVAGQIGQRHMLLVLDNCEHVIVACARLAERLLRSCAHLQILATSREPLHVLGEVAFRVPSLSLPDPGEAHDFERLTRSEAVQLFAERAQSAARGFALDAHNAPAVVEVCMRLDGMPLAIELAAARSAGLSPSQIAERLRDSLAVLGGGNRGALTRQQTLSATIGWSHDLLDAEERTLFRRLSMFAGGFSLEAAEGVCALDDLPSAQIADVLGRLVDKSLVLSEEEAGQRRYRLLQIVRQYARERLGAAREGERIEGAHRGWYLELAQCNDPELGAPSNFADAIEPEYDNLRAALASALEHAPAEALRLCVHLWAFWMARGYFVEGTRWLDEALARAPERTVLRARALLHGCALALRSGAVQRFRPFGRESIDILRETGEHAAQADALQQVAGLERQIWDLPEADRLLEQSQRLAEDLADPAALASARSGQAMLAYVRGNYLGATRLLEQAIELLRRAGNSERPFFPTSTLGMIVLEDEQDRPRCFFEETVVVFRRVSARAAVGWTLCNLASALRSAGQLDAAQAAVDEALALFRRQDDPMGGSMALSALGCLARSRREFDRGREALRQAQSLRRRLGDRRGAGMTLGNLALIEAAAGSLERARALIEEALEGFARTDDVPGMSCTRINLGNLELAAGSWEAARSAFELGSSSMAAIMHAWTAGWASLTLAEGAITHGDPRAAEYLARARTWLAGHDTRALVHLQRLETRLVSR
jgi:predicted ATPase/DNA-binding SARP family transcriptional activator